VLVLAAQELALALEQAQPARAQRDSEHLQALR